MRQIRKSSLAGRVAALAIASVATSLVVFLAFKAFAQQFFTHPGLMAVALTFLIMVPFVVVGAQRITRGLQRSALGLTDALRSFQDGDFSLRLRAEDSRELAEAVDVYNSVADVLRAERNALYQKELLLDTILQGAPMAVILTNPADRIVYSNLFARQLFAAGGNVDGHRFAELLGEIPSAVRAALASGADSLISFRDRGHDETYHLSRRIYYLNTQKHTLYVVKRLTQELRRQEIQVWKKAIRLMNHELNNSIAPISSLIHSVRHVSSHPEHAHRIEEIFDTIDERLGYLKKFLEGYAQFARLPAPRKRAVAWDEVVAGIRGMLPFQLQGEMPSRPALVDPAQMQQVLINLLKNAVESGSPPEEIFVAIESSNGAGTTIQVLDRGRGMSPEEMERALLPFYSSKQTGTGLGLPLCNEIIEAHGGNLRLQNRESGGLAVTCWLP